MKKKKILVVEDDKSISSLLKYNLEKAEFECTVAFTGDEALKMLDKDPVDLIILDIMLPFVDGFEVCRQIKQNKTLKNIPVIILTAKGEEVDRIVGLELGADDYIVKPFSPRELILRVKAILRRNIKEENIQDILIEGLITIDISRHKVIVNKKEIELTPMEFKLLLTLIERKGRVQTRETLLSHVWGMNSDVFTRTVDTHIKRLREKLGKSGKLIETVIGMGYRFKQEEEE